MADGEIDDRTSVLVLFGMAGLSPAPDEIDNFVKGYAASRQMVAALHAMPEVRYEVPAVTFDARVVFP